MVIVGNAIHEGVYPLSKAPDQGILSLRRSATPAISSHYLPHISVLPIRWVGGAWFRTYDLSSRSRELYQLSYPDTMQVTNNQVHSHFVRRPTGRCQGEGPLNQSSQVHVRECTPSGVSVRGSLSCLFWPGIKCSIGSCQFNI